MNLIPVEDGKPPSRDKILEAERLIAQAPQVEFKVIHYFAPGLYARELHIPAGHVLTGKIHKTEHLCTISKGRIHIQSEFGGGVFEAPHTFVSKPGVKRIGYAETDTVFTCYHATHETDLAKLEAELVCDTYEELSHDVLKLLEAGS
jgi:hypothetical protein